MGDAAVGPGPFAVVWVPAVLEGPSGCGSPGAHLLVPPGRAVMLSGLFAFIAALACCVRAVCSPDFPAAFPVQPCR
jgi:hypothetical protein